MIPTMILFGALLGRWWWIAIIMGIIGWPIVLLLGGNSLTSISDILLAAGLGGANTALGVAIHQAVLWGWRMSRH